MNTSFFWNFKGFTFPLIQIANHLSRIDENREKRKFIKNLDFSLFTKRSLNTYIYRKPTKGGHIY